MGASLEAVIKQFVNLTLIDLSDPVTLHLQFSRLKRWLQAYVRMVSIV